MLSGVRVARWVCDHASRIVRILAIGLILVAEMRAAAYAQSNGLMPSFLDGGFQQAYINNRPLSLDVRRFTTFYVGRSERHAAVIHLNSPSAKALSVMPHSHGSISTADPAACGVLDSYNFVSVVIHSAPGYIDAHTKWSTRLPIQFIDCSGASLKLPVDVTVDRLVGRHLQLHVVGKIGGPIMYEGGPSSTHLYLDLRMQFNDGKFFECDGTALEDLDSVNGHSAWILIPLSS
jgi:hypothetical protein